MKRYLFTLILCFVGMTAFTQALDVSYFRKDYLRQDGTFEERLRVLEAVRDARLTGVGSFFHEALKFLLARGADITSKQDRAIAEQSAVILCEGLAEEKVAAAAADLWQTVVFFDVARDNNEGFAMQAALIAIGQIDGKDYAPHVVQRLNFFNTQTFSDVETRRRVQRAVTGCVKALESFHDIEGYRPVFFVYIGSYDKNIQDIAANTLPNIVDDPSEVISAIIRDPSNNPRVKLDAWREMLRTRASGASKAKVAAVALSTGWNYSTTDVNFQTNLREMRKGAIDTIRQFGAPDDSIFTSLEKSYSNNFINANPDFDEIRFTLTALSAIKTDPAVELLQKFLNELHERRRSGPWARKERQCFEWVIFNIGATGTQSSSIKFLLATIQRDSKYTSAEKKMVESTMKALGMN
ncbi:MAG: hypothetical protein LBV17_01470 [Treponema sp.]|jgi:hypothetical protein|nr:hypothetical protein [Treponema sp.]